MREQWEKELSVWHYFVSLQFTKYGRSAEHKHTTTMLLSPTTAVVTMTVLVISGTVAAPGESPGIARRSLNVDVARLDFLNTAPGSGQYCKPTLRIAYTNWDCNYEEKEFVGRFG